METDNPFEQVLDRLREKGWCKKDWGDSQGPNCIRGAMGQAGVDQWNLGIPALLPIIESEYPKRKNDRYERIAYFNDHPATTFSDVERVLEKAAVKWEEERVVRDD